MEPALYKFSFFCFSPLKWPNDRNKLTVRTFSAYLCPSLEEAGLNWSPRQSKFEERFKELTDFKDAFGNAPMYLSRVSITTLEDGIVT